MARFADRHEAGAQLAERLRSYRDEAPIIFALPRGGLPVAVEVARVLDAPLDVLVAARVCAPTDEGCVLGAVAEGGAVCLDREAIERLNLIPEELAALAGHEADEVERRLLTYRDGASAPDLRGRTAIVIDDGGCPSVAVRAAVRHLRNVGATRVVLGTPVLARACRESLEPELDALVALTTVDGESQVAQAYEQFPSVSETTALQLLSDARGFARSPAPADAAPMPVHSEVKIPAGEVELTGLLRIPRGARGMVLFVHGSGSSRFSPRNLAVARALEQAGFGTLLIDLLSEEEEREDELSGELRFDIELLSGRVRDVVDWLGTENATRALPLGLFGASTGAAAALTAAAERPERVHAVVSRGGRPDLAPAQVLGRVRAPVLLIVGGDDTEVLALNHTAAHQLHAPVRLAVVEGATHLFSEPGALEQVMRLALHEFELYLAPQPSHLHA